MSRCYRVELPSSGAQQVVRGYEILCQSKNKCNTVCKWPALMHSSNTDLSLKKSNKKIILVMLIWTLSEKTKQACDSTHLNSLCIKNLFLWVKMSLLCIEPQGHTEGTETKAVLNYTLISQSHSHLLQLMMTSSGWILFFSMPCLGCSPLPRNNPGGSILKLPMRSLWWSRRQ